MATPDSIADDLLTGIPAAAEFLGRTPRAVYHLVANERIPFIRNGRRLYFRKSELDAAFTGDVSGRETSAQ
ncbi:helix-turn-helix domain-containing protein [Parasphingorhabdus sp.]|uniref:helix-turn-helix domain-containing protein n=1 Tax=Parasphingorhabdus sp. TaxID=2709688 RepID=UPI002F920DB4